MLDDLRDGLPVVLFRIFYLKTNLTRRFAFPDHWDVGGRQLPVGRAGRHVRTGDVLFLMAGAAPLTIFAETVESTPYVLRMHVAVIALTREVAVSMAIETSWMLEHGNDGDEEFARTRIVGLEGAACRSWK